MTALSELLNEAKDDLGISGNEISYRAQQAGMSLSKYTVSVYLNGRHGAPDEKTVAAFAYVLRIPPERVRAAAGMPADHGEFTLPEEARVLTPAQRDAVREVVRLFVEANHQEVHPERSGLDLAADNGHGLAPGQVEGGVA